MSRVAKTERCWQVKDLQSRGGTGTQTNGFVFVSKWKGQWGQSGPIFGQIHAAVQVSGHFMGCLFFLLGHSDYCVFFEWRMGWGDGKFKKSRPFWTLEVLYLPLWVRFISIWTNFALFELQFLVISNCFSCKKRLQLVLLLFQVYFKCRWCSQWARCTMHREPGQLFVHFKPCFSGLDSFCRHCSTLQYPRCGRHASFLRHERPICLRNMFNSTGFTR